MRKMWKAATSLLALGFLVGSVPIHVKAEEYRYQITIYSGNQGVFSGTEGLSVNGADYDISSTADAIVIRDLNPGDIVSFEPRAGAVTMESESKYYIQGVRISGRDNNAAVQESSFRVEEDQEYVVAYGIKGNQVAYTINYQDQNGNKLADSQTFYGNIGDKPVVAYAYVEGYTPEYRNLTKTLSSNEADNVFTFTYMPKETKTVTVPGETRTSVTEQTVTVPGATATGGTTGGNRVSGGSNTATGGTVTSEDEQNTERETTGGPGNTENTQDAQETDAENTASIEDQETPLADQELKDLDEEEVPKSNTSLDDKKVKKGLPLVAGIGIGVAACAALTAGAVILKRRIRR